MDKILSARAALEQDVFRQVLEGLQQGNAYGAGNIRVRIGSTASPNTLQPMLEEARRRIADGYLNRIELPRCEPALAELGSRFLNEIMALASTASDARFSTEREGYAERERRLNDRFEVLERERGELQSRLAGSQHTVAVQTASLDDAEQQLRLQQIRLDEARAALQRSEDAAADARHQHEVALAAVRQELASQLQFFDSQYKAMAETTANERERTRQSHAEQVQLVEHAARESVRAAQAAVESAKDQAAQLELRVQALSRDNGLLQRQLGEAEGQGKAVERERDSLAAQAAQWQQRYDTLLAGRTLPAATDDPTLPSGLALPCPVCEEPLRVGGMEPGQSMACVSCDADLVIGVVNGDPGLLSAADPALQEDHGGDDA